MINIAATLKRCQIDKLVKRVVKTRQIDQTVYLICEARDGQWVYVVDEPSGFDAIFRATEADAIAWAPKPIQRGWT